MGKGTINSHLGDGEYSVTLNFDSTRVAEEISRLDIVIADWQTRIALMPAGQEKNLATLKLRSFQLRKSYLIGNTPSDPTVNAWCADLTEDLSGVVGTIEVPGERGTVLIRPGYDGNAVYNSTRDGQLQPLIASPAAQVFYNIAMLPGWQKWMPLYRFGTITVIDYDLNTCSVNMEAAASSAQGINVNQDTSLTDVPIEYLACNSAAFEVGDDVLIEFEGQNPNSPKVIGFKEEPKGCGFTITLSRGDSVPITLAWLVANNILLRFRVYTSSQVLVEHVTASAWGVSGALDHDGNKWILDQSQWSGQDSNGYWIDYRLESIGPGETDSIEGYTQYPSIVRTSLKRNALNLIKSGDYVDEIPYWVYENPNHFSGRNYDGGAGWAGTYAECPTESTPFFGYQWNPARTQYEWRIWLREGQSVTRIYRMKSSIPYQVTYSANTDVCYAGSVHWLSNWGPTCSWELCAGGYEDDGNIFRNPSPFRVQVGLGLDVQGGTTYEGPIDNVCIAINPDVVIDVESDPDVDGKDIIVTLTNQASGNLDYECNGDPYSGTYVWSMIASALGHVSNPNPHVGHVEFDYDY